MNHRNTDPTAYWDGPIGAPWLRHTDEYAVAAKTWTCYSCDQPILVGELYYRYRGTPWTRGNESGEFWLWRLCEWCGRHIWVYADPYSGMDDSDVANSGSWITSEWLDLLVREGLLDPPCKFYADPWADTRDELEAIKKADADRWLREQEGVK
jgi:hypothetical protein